MLRTLGAVLVACLGALVHAASTPCGHFATSVATCSRAPGALACGVIPTSTNLTTTHSSSDAPFRCERCADGYVAADGVRYCGCWDAFTFYGACPAAYCALVPARSDGASTMRCSVVPRGGDAWDASCRAQLSCQACHDHTDTTKRGRSERCAWCPQEGRCRSAMAAPARAGACSITTCSTAPSYTYTLRGFYAASLAVAVGVVAVQAIVYVVVSVRQVSSVVARVSDGSFAYRTAADATTISISPPTLPRIATHAALSKRLLGDNNPQPYAHISAPSIQRIRSGSGSTTSSDGTSVSMATQQPLPLPLPTNPAVPQSELLEADNVGRRRPFRRRRPPFDYDAYDVSAVESYGAGEILVLQAPLHQQQRRLLGVAAAAGGVGTLWHFIQIWYAYATLLSMHADPSAEPANGSDSTYFCGTRTSVTCYFRDDNAGGGTRGWPHVLGGACTRYWLPVVLVVYMVTMVKKHTVDYGTRVSYFPLTYGDTRALHDRARQPAPLLAWARVVQLLPWLLNVAAAGLLAPLALSPLTDPCVDAGPSRIALAEWCASLFFCLVCVVLVLGAAACALPRGDSAARCVHAACAVFLLGGCGIAVGYLCALVAVAHAAADCSGDSVPECDRLEGSNAETGGVALQVVLFQFLPTAIDAAATAARWIVDLASWTVLRCSLSDGDAPLPPPQPSHLADGHARGSVNGSDLDAPLRGAYDPDDAPATRCVLPVAATVPATTTASPRPASRGAATDDDDDDGFYTARSHAAPATDRSIASTRLITAPTPRRRLATTPRAAAPTAAPDASDAASDASDISFIEDPFTGETSPDFSPATRREQRQATPHA